MTSTFWSLATFLLITQSKLVFCIGSKGDGDPVQELNLEDNLIPQSQDGLRMKSESGAVTDKAVIIPIMHSLGNNKGTVFTNAGTIVGRLKAVSENSQKLKNAQVERLELSNTEKESLQEIIQKDGFYRIKLPNSFHESQDYVISSVKARCLLFSNFVENFILHMDGHGNIETLNYVAVGNCSDGVPKRKQQEIKFTSFVSVKRGSKAEPLIPAVERLEALDQRTELKPGELPPPPKTFWQKNWMYIMVFGLILLNSILSGMQDPSQGSGAGGAAAGQRRGPQRR